VAHFSLVPLYCHHPLRDLHSFPTRRSSDLMQGPFHGERMRGFAPLVAELARQELGGWRGRVSTLDRMRHLTLEIILRVIFGAREDRKCTRLNSSHVAISYAVFCLKKKKTNA